MYTQAQRDLNDSLDMMVRLTGHALRDAERAANGSSCHTITWTLRSCEQASAAALRAHRDHYNEDLAKVMAFEEEIEALEEEKADYVNRVHREIFPQV